MKISFTLNGVCRSVSAEPGESLQVLLQRMGIPSVRSSDDREGFAGQRHDTVRRQGGARRAHGGRPGRRARHRDSGGPHAKGPALRAPGGDARGRCRAVRDTTRLRPRFSWKTFFGAGKSPPRMRCATRSRVFSAGQPATSSSSWRSGWRVREGSGGVWSAPVAPAFGDGLRVIGKSARKIDGGKLAAGMKAYVEDRAETGSCVLLMLRSPHAHALIRSIDTARRRRCRAWFS